MFSDGMASDLTDSVYSVKLTLLRIFLAPEFS